MRLNPQISITGTSQTISDFWQWAYSDIVGNRNRGIFAEFLVGAALDALTDTRVEWDAVDLLYRGKRIEVKSAAYVQSWAQSKPSKIVFDIGEKLSWDAATNTYATERQRGADCYIFCLFVETDRTKAQESILNEDHWHFYVLSTDFINNKFPKMKKLAFKRLCEHCEPVTYHELRRRVDDALFKQEN